MNKLVKSARTAEAADTSGRIIAFYGADAGLQNESFLTPLFTRLKDLTDKITEAIRKDKALSDLEDADAVRDAAISDIFKIVEGYAVMRIDSLSKPAKKILTILENFRGIAKKNYTEESSLIDAMLKDLEALSAEVDSLVGLREAVDFLRTAQDDFATKRQVYEKSQAENKQADTASALKKPLLDIINEQLLPYLTSMKMADPAKYGTLADQVQTTINTTNLAVKTRSAKKKEVK